MAIPASGLRWCDIPKVSDICNNVGRIYMINNDDDGNNDNNNNNNIY